MNRHAWWIAGGLITGILVGCADDFAPGRTHRYTRAVQDPVERGSERAEVLGDSDGTTARTGNGIPIAEVDFDNHPGEDARVRVTAIDNAKATLAATQPTTIPTATQPTQPPNVIVVDPITGSRP